MRPALGCSATLRALPCPFRRPHALLLHCCSPSPTIRPPGPGGCVRIERPRPTAQRHAESCGSAAVLRGPVAAPSGRQPSARLTGACAFSRVQLSVPDGAPACPDKGARHTNAMLTPRTSAACLQCLCARALLSERSASSILAAGPPGRSGGRAQQLRACCAAAGQRLLEEGAIVW